MDSFDIETAGLQHIADKFGEFCGPDDDSEIPKDVLNHIKGCIESHYERNVSLANEYLQDFHEQNPLILPDMINVKPEIKRGIITINEPSKTEKMVGKHKYKINFGKEFMYHHRVEPEDLQDLICHAVAHILCNHDKSEKCTLKSHGDDWKEHVKYLGCNPDEKCKPAKFLDDETVVGALSEQPKREKTKVSRTSTGAVLALWKAICPDGCVLFFGTGDSEGPMGEKSLGRWIKKVGYPVCKNHNKPCAMYKRIGKGPKYSDKPFTDDSVSFGFFTFGSEKFEDGALITIDPETGKWVDARKELQKMIDNEEICVEPIDEPKK